MSNQPPDAPPVDPAASVAADALDAALAPRGQLIDRGALATAGPPGAWYTRGPDGELVGPLLAAPEPVSLGQVGFDAYGDCGQPAPWQTFDGRPMPRWPALETAPGLETRRRWEVAGEAIVRAYCARAGLPFLLCEDGTVRCADAEEAPRSRPGSRHTIEVAVKGAEDVEALTAKIRGLEEAYAAATLAEERFEAARRRFVTGGPLASAAPQAIRYVFAIESPPPVRGDAGEVARAIERAACAGVVKAAREKWERRGQTFETAAAREIEEEIRARGTPPAFGTRAWFLSEPFAWEQEGDYHRTNDGPEGDGWRYEYVARDFGTCTERRLVLHVDAAGQITDEHTESDLPALVQARAAERRWCAKVARDHAEATAAEIAGLIEAAPPPPPSADLASDRGELRLSMCGKRVYDPPPEVIGYREVSYGADTMKIEVEIRTPPGILRHRTEGSR